MDAGLQIKELAAMVGVTEDTVINWELRGIKTLRIQTKDKINEFLMGKR
jgi:DNA-binding transcriptional regulator YiaG